MPDKQLTPEEEKKRRVRKQARSIHNVLLVEETKEAINKSKATKADKPQQ